MLIDNAAQTMEFNSIEQMDQGATTLYSITRWAPPLLGTGQGVIVGQRGTVGEKLSYERRNEHGNNIRCSQNTLRTRELKQALFEE